QEKPQKSEQKLHLLIRNDKMSNLTARSADLLQTYLKKCKRSPGAFIFGPGKRSDFDGLKQLLNQLKIGYFGSYATEKTDKGGLPEYVFMHVLHNQARKLSEVLIELDIREEIDFLKT